MVGAAVAGVASVGSALIGSSSAKKAGKAQAESARYAADVEKYMYDTTRSDYAPYRQVGQGALYKLADMYGVERPVDTSFYADGTAGWQQPPNAPGGKKIGGLPYMFGGGSIPTPTTGKPKPVKMTEGFDDFKASPGYEFRLGEAMKAIERSAAARGSLRSGGTMKALGRYADGLASSEYENYANRLAALAGVGQSATAGTAAAGAQAAHGMGNAYMQAGNAKANAHIASGQAIAGGLQNIAGAYLYSNTFNKMAGK